LSPERAVRSRHRQRRCDGPPEEHDGRGFETQFGTNHLGHFVLVNRIAALMKPGSRLVNLSSAGHRYADIDLDDPNFERTPYTEFVRGPWPLEDRQHPVATRRTASGRTAVHPGSVQTELIRHMKPEDVQRLMDRINAASLAAGGPASGYKTIPQGGATTVWAGARRPG
jgi:hypothetical protein